MTIHLVGLPHTPLDKERAYSCAYTTKAANYLKTLAALGEPVVVYWGGDDPGPLPDGVEYVAATTVAIRHEDFGEFDPTKQPEVTWGWSEPRWLRFAAGVISGLSTRMAKGDVVMFQSGMSHKITQDWVKEYGGVSLLEPAVGYDGVARANGTWQGYESNAWMHFCYGKHGIGDGRWYDRVIPGFADPDQFHIQARGKEPFVLFLGRVIQRKGPHVAAQIAQMAGMKFVAAGTGATYDKTKKLVQGNGIQFHADEWKGALNPKLRARLMSQAALVIVPTLYIEPFGTVHVEAMMAGTPVLTSPFGVFRETVPQVQGAAMFHTPRDAVRIITETDLLDTPRRLIREQAVARWTPAAIVEETARWVHDVRELTAGRGW